MKLLVSLLFILFSGVNAFAQNASGTQYFTIDTLGKDEIILENWMYKQADDSSFALPLYNDSGWETVNPKFDVWEKHNSALLLKSILWLRKYIHIDSSLSTYSLSMMMHHYGASEIYVDGKRIGKFGRIGSREEIQYEFPNSPMIINLKPGIHLVAVRYANYDFERNYNRYQETSAGFELSISRADYTSKMLLVKTRTVLISSMFFFAFFLAFFLSHLLIYFLNRQEKANFYFSFFCLALSLIFLEFALRGISSSVTIHLLGKTTLIISGAIMSVSLSGFLNTLFGTKKLRFKIIAVLTLLSAIYWFTFLNGIPIGVVIILVCIEAAFLIIRALFRETSGAVGIGIGLLIFTACLFTVIFNAVYNETDINIGGGIGMALILATISLPISMSIYLSRNYATINKNLKKQLVQVETLSEKTIQQELEKQRMLENRQEELETEVLQRTSELQAQKQKSDDLLLNILPEEVAEELKEKGTSAAKYFDHVSVLFTDFVDFTKAGERLTPQQLVDELHACFMKFDEICSKYNIEKIKTIGDAYLAVSGLPLSDEEHAINITKAAIEIREFIAERKLAKPDTSFNIRIGIHSGSVVAGIVGVKKFAYDIWGDTVNTAARMEQSSESGKINISEFTYQLIKDRFRCTFRGQITAKSKGEMNMYFVEGEN